MEEKVANGLRCAIWRRCAKRLQHSTPRQEIEVDPNEEVIRLSAHAELQLERQVVQGRDAPSRGVWRTLLLVMSSLFKAADSALREKAGRGVREVHVVG